MDFATIASTYGTNYRKFDQRSFEDGQTLVADYVANRGNISWLLTTQTRRSDVVRGTEFGRKYGQQSPASFAREITRVFMTVPSRFISLRLAYPRGAHAACFHVRCGSVTLFDPNYGFLDLQLPLGEDSVATKREKLRNLVDALTAYLDLVHDHGGPMIDWELRDIYSRTEPDFLAPRSVGHPVSAA